MRSGSLLISVLVHGGALGVAVCTGVYGLAEIARPHVEVVLQDAATPNAAARPPAACEPLPVEPDPADLEVELVEPPVVPLPELAPRATDAADEPLPPRRQPTLERVRTSPPPPPAPQSAPATADPELVAVPPEAAPQPASSRVDACPLATNEPPVYPRRERSLGLEGVVVVIATVDATGAVTAVRLGERSVHAGFNRAALAAVRRWRFEPAWLDGRAVAAEVPVPIEFCIRPGS